MKPNSKPVDGDFFSSLLDGVRQPGPGAAFFVPVDEEGAGRTALLRCSVGLVLATRLRGWCGEGPAHGFGLPIYDHAEGVRGEVGLAATFTSNRLAAVIFY